MARGYLWLRTCSKVVGVRRLLQLGTVMLLLAVFMPIEEVFDQWDTPGLANDTEFAVFTIVFALCLVLLVSTLIAGGLLRFGLICLRSFQCQEKARNIEPAETSVWAVPPLSLGPLRI